METRVFEFKFPNGDFEIDATARVPHVGDLIRTRGRLWKVDRIEPSIPWVIVLRSIEKTRAQDKRSA